MIKYQTALIKFEDNSIKTLEEKKEYAKNVKEMRQQIYNKLPDKYKPEYKDKLSKIKETLDNIEYTKIVSKTSTLVIRHEKIEINIQP